MTPRHFLAILMATILHGNIYVPAHVNAQSVASRNTNWSPYRPLATVDIIKNDSSVADIAARPTITPSQFEDCEPCPPGYTEFISDMELQQMRGPRGSYYTQPATAQPIFVDPNTGNPFMTAQPASNNWDWELLPGDVIWHSYMAGTKESRMSGTVFEELGDDTTLLDVTLGGRASLLRYGNRVNGQAYGWEVQIEGAGMPRLNLDENWDLEAADFRFGVPLIYGNDRVQFKLSYYHLSSHLGDEFIERTNFDPTQRVNYARDEIVIGASFFPLPAWRWYAEAGWGFYADEGADPWEFQFGLDYSQPGPTDAFGTPFFAVNGHLREEVDYGGEFVAQAGWLWRGHTGKVIRTGVHYLNGKSNQYAFSGPLEESEQQIGGGLWYDF
jgi:hypothetical protein